MKIEVFPSASGDCVLVTSRDGRRLLADAGLPTAYDDFIASPLAALRKANIAIDVAYVSHIDRDHIGGILRMLDHEMAWRAFEHMKKNNRPFREPTVPRPPEIREIWHNAFLEYIGTTEAVDLGAALAASANALAGLRTADIGDARMAARAAEIEMLALSVGDALEVNWRIGADQLDIPLNTPFDGKLMVARPDRPIELGTLRITVLGPTAKQLAKLREEWIAWLRKNTRERDRLRAKHRQAAEDLISGLPPTELARHARDMALAIETDVTPPNLASLVLLVEEDGKRLLLTGDAGDESLLEYLDAAGLLDTDGRIEVDVLKVPHHGAHNSFSEKFVASVRAANYIFCGDGEHDNPEPDVVEGYLRAAKATPLSTGGISRFWFNWSGTRATEFKELWKEVEGKFVPATASIKRRSLYRNYTRLTLEL